MPANVPCCAITKKSSHKADFFGCLPFAFDRMLKRKRRVYFIHFSRTLFSTTETELSAIAALASMGFSSMP